MHTFAVTVNGRTWNVEASNAAVATKRAVEHYWNESGVGKAELRQRRRHAHVLEIRVRDATFDGRKEE